MTSTESQWMSAIASMGCVVCLRQGNPGVPAEVHHILSGGRRIGHLSTIPLCSPGHHRNGSGDKISRHPWKARFEEAYGTEQFLLEWTRNYLNALDRRAA